MAESEPFTMISESKHAGPQLFEEYHKDNGAKLADLDIQLVTELRAQYSDLIVT